MKERSKEGGKEGKGGEEGKVKEGRGGKDGRRGWKRRRKEREEGARQHLYLSDPRYAAHS